MHPSFPSMPYFTQRTIKSAVNLSQPQLLLPSSLDLDQLRSVLQDSNQIIDILLNQYLEQHNNRLLKGETVPATEVFIMKHLYRMLYVASVSNTLDFKLPYIVYWFQRTLKFNRFETFTEMYKIASHVMKEKKEQPTRDQQLRSPSSQRRQRARRIVRPVSSTDWKQFYTKKKGQQTVFLLPQNPASKKVVTESTEINKKQREELKSARLASPEKSSRRQLREIREIREMPMPQLIVLPKQWIKKKRSTRRLSRWPTTKKMK